LEERLMAAVAREAPTSDVRCALCDVRGAMCDVRCAMCAVRCAMCDGGSCSEWRGGAPAAETQRTAEAAQAVYDAAVDALEKARNDREEAAAVLAVHQREMEAWDLLSAKEVAALTEQELLLVAVALHDPPDMSQRAGLCTSTLRQCLQETKDAHLAVWERWRKRREVEIGMLVRQLERVEEHKRECTARAEVAHEEARIRHVAVAQVRAWAADGNLCRFLQRCGVQVGDDADRVALQKAYRKMMLRYHPDRMSGKSVEDRVLAEEITKHVTSSLAAIDERAAA